MACEGRVWVVNRLLENSHIRGSCNTGSDHKPAVVDSERPAALLDRDTGKFGQKLPFLQRRTTALRLKAAAICWPDRSLS